MYLYVYPHAEIYFLDLQLVIRCHQIQAMLDWAHVLLMDLLQERGILILHL